MLSKLTTALAVLIGALVLAACGGDDSGGLEGGTEDAADVETAQGGEPSGELTISNWPLYIDKQTIPNFEKETGVTTKYIEDINDNTEFFGKLRPQLAQGESGGRSIIVPTDWMAAKMYDLGYIQNLDKSAIPNVTENLIPSLQSPSFDPERNYSVPWQSGMTGIIVRKDLAPDITSINDLFDPKYKGKVDDAERDARHGAAGDEGRRRRSRERDRRGLARGDRQDPGGGRLRADPRLHRQRLRRRPHPRRRGRGDRLVRRRGPAAGRQPEHRVADARRGLHALVGQHGDPGRGAQHRRGAGVHELRLRPRGRRRTSPSTSNTSRRSTG